MLARLCGPGPPGAPNIYKPTTSSLIMKKKSTSQSAFFNLRVLIGLFVVLVGACVALSSSGVFSVTAANIDKALRQNQVITSSSDPLVPVGFDCSKIHQLGIDKQENFRAGAIMKACGAEPGGSPNTRAGGPLSRLVQKLLAPFTYGGTDVDLINHPETSPNVTQSETYSMANPDNPNQVVVAYNDSRGRNASPINISGASVSTDGGTTFDRLTLGSGQGPFSNTVGDPVVLYHRPTGTWFTVWLDGACGGQGIGGYKSTTPEVATSWTHFPCVHSGGSDDRESGWSDVNPASPFYGRLYVSFNNFALGGPPISVIRSTDGGATWSAPVNLAVPAGATFVRDVQITGDYANGDVYVAGMDENSGNGCTSGCGTNRRNVLYRSTDGGVTFTATPYVSPTAFVGPCRSSSGYFCTMYSSPAYWRHMGWGEPAVFNHVVSLVYAEKDGADPGNVYYIRSTDSGLTFSAPFQLNSNTDATKAQWQPNISVSPSGTLLATWYDETPRVAASCQPSSPGTPCYQMYSRKSNDNGLTWQPDMALSDVASPLPTQPDPGIVPIYASDYDYGSATAVKHVTSWVDGRVAISGQSQPDAFTDEEPSAVVSVLSAVSRKVHGGNPFDVSLPGVECRTTGGTNDYAMVITFSGNVTVTGTPQAQVIAGTGCVGSSGVCTGNVLVNGAVVTVPLTNIANAQIIHVRIFGVNGAADTPAADFDVVMGILVGDTNGNGTVNAADVAQTKGRLGQTVDGTNFRSDVNVNNSINAADTAIIKQNSGTSLPPQ